MKSLIKKLGYFALCAVAVCFTNAARAELPVVSDVTMSQQGHRMVTITYRLTGGSGIVTLEILKNGEPIDGTLVQGVTGDVNKLVEPTTGDEVRTIKWRADKSWPDQSFNEPTVSARVTAWATNTPPKVLVVDLDTGLMNYYLNESYLPEGGLTNDLYRTTKMALCRVPAGGVETTLGGFRDEFAYQFSESSNKEARHKVRFTKDFYMGVFEVTQAQWLKFRSSNPSSFSHPDYAATRPVESVSYNSIRSSCWTPKNKVAINADSYLGKLNALTGATFDLPTECQWEFAAHGGTDEMFYNGRTYITCSGGGGNKNEKLITAATNNLSRLGRWSGNGGIVDGMPETTWDYKNNVPQSDFSGYTTEAGTARVGSYLPNDYGLYDMLGNVGDICREAAMMNTNLCEWSATDIIDPVSSWAYGSTTQADIPENPSFNPAVLAKGGDWRQSWEACRPAAKSTQNYQWEGKRWGGFRVILEIQ